MPAIFLLILKAIPLILKASLAAILSNLPAIIASVLGTIVVQSQQPQLLKGVASTPFGLNAALWAAIGAGVVMVAQKYGDGGVLVKALSGLKSGVKWVQAQWAAIP